VAQKAKQMDNKEFREQLKKRIYNLVLSLVRFCEKLPSDSSSRIIRDQLIRSGTSVGANYIEAQAASSTKDFMNYLNHSLKSANESKFWLSLLRDLHRGDQTEIDSLLGELSEIANILSSAIPTMKGKK
jgi:four helix bundle protein